ncbi:MAG: hypothetical protein NVSMB6_33110 [Burkholderiaceae bacterium]
MTDCPTCDQYQKQIDHAKLGVTNSENALRTKESWRVDAVARGIYEGGISDARQRVADVERWYAEHLATAHLSVDVK